MMVGAVKWLQSMSGMKTKGVASCSLRLQWRLLSRVMWRGLAAVGAGGCDFDGEALVT